MSEAIDISLDDDEGHLVDPPIIDLLFSNPDRKTYAITFIPEDRVSPREKEVIEVPYGTEDGKRVEVRLQAISRLVGGDVHRVCHSGSGDFSFEFSGGRSYRLSTHSPLSEATQEIYDHLQDLGMVAQIAYLDTRLSKAKTA